MTFVAPRLPLLPLVALAAGLLAGCSTQRTLVLDSDPPGARVWVNGEDKGVAPVAVPFVHYGTFDVRLEKKGYEAWGGEVRVPSRIDGYPIVDLPFELAVRRRGFCWTGHLRPSPAESDQALEQLVEEARTFRDRTLREARPDAPPQTAPAPAPTAGRR